MNINPVAMLLCNATGFDLSGTLGQSIVRLHYAFLDLTSTA